MEREFRYSTESKRSFVHAVQSEIDGNDGMRLIPQALTYIISYEAALLSENPPDSLDAFIVSLHSNPDDPTVPDDPAIRLARSLYTTLSPVTEHPIDQAAVLAPFRHAKETMKLWIDISSLRKHDKTKQLTELVTSAMHENPDDAKNIIESFIARVTVGEIVTKPLIGLVAVTALAHSMPGWMSTDAGIQSLMVSTVLLAILKTEQDINNKQNNKPFLTVETNILVALLGYELRRSAYFVRIAWLVPAMAGPVLAYLQTGADISPFLVTQSLLYLGPMVGDFLLRMDLMDATVAKAKKLFRKKQWDDPPEK